MTVTFRVSIRDRNGYLVRVVGESVDWREAHRIAHDVGPLNAGYFVRTEAIGDKPIPDVQS